MVTRDIAGVGDERDAASRAPPGRMGGRAPAARAREAPDGRGEGAGGCRQARSQSSDRLERNLLVWAANELGGHGGRGRRASPRWLAPPNADKWDGHIVQWAESSASEPPRPKLTSQINAAPNADKRTDDTASGRCAPALQDGDFSEGASRAKSISF